MKDKLIRHGYLPENLPPAFTTSRLADHLAGQGRTYLTTRDSRLRPALYNASKRGMTRRVFSLCHPVTAHDTSEFIERHHAAIQQHFEIANYSLSTPIFSEDGIRAFSITTPGELEKRLFEKLSPYKYIVKTDISRYYHSIYTHSIPWAIHGKE